MHTHYRPTAAGWTLALASTVAFSIGAPLATAVFRTGVDPTLAMGLRMLITMLLLGVTLAARGPQQLRMDGKGLFITVASGVLTGISTLLFFWALLRMDTSIAAMLFSLFPLVVLLLLALRGEPFTGRNIVRLALAVAGGYLLVGVRGGTADLIGILMVGGSILCSALQTVFIQWYLRGYHGLTVTFYMVGGMALVIVAWWLVQGAEWVAPSAPAWLGIGAMAIVSTYLARLAMFAALRQLGSGQMALLVPLETMLTVVWSVLFLADRLTLVQVVGSGLILSSTVLAIERLWGKRRG
jgi:drug/metabolite transporter (DMT)-like permease